MTPGQAFLTGVGGIVVVIGAIVAVALMPGPPPDPLAIRTVAAEPPPVRCVGSADVTELIQRLHRITDNHGEEYGGRGGTILTLTGTFAELDLTMPSGSELVSRAPSLVEAVAKLRDPTPEIRDALEGWTQAVLEKHSGMIGSTSSWVFEASTAPWHDGTAVPPLGGDPGRGRITWGADVLHGVIGPYHTWIGDRTEEEKLLPYVVPSPTNSDVPGHLGPLELEPQP